MENNELEQPIEEVQLDVAKVKTLIPSYSSEKLCEMIVAARYFNISQEITLACMEELAIRRTAGEIFNFEQYIEDSYAKLPVINFNVPDLRITLQQALKNRK